MVVAQAADRTARALGHGMAERLERRDDAGSATAPRARTSTGGAKCSSGSTNQRGAATAVAMSTPAVDERRHELGVDLRLGVAAHRPGHDPRPPLAVPEQHPGQERVERPLAGLEDVGVGRVEAEVRAAVLVVDAGLGIDARPTRSPSSSTRSG